MSCQQVPRLPADPYTFTEPPVSAQYFSTQPPKAQNSLISVPLASDRYGSTTTSTHSAALLATGQPISTVQTPPQHHQKPPQQKKKNRLTSNTVTIGDISFASAASSLGILSRTSNDIAAKRRAADRPSSVGQQPPRKSATLLADASHPRPLQPPAIQLTEVRGGDHSPCGHSSDSSSNCCWWPPATGASPTAANAVAQALASAQLPPTPPSSSPVYAPHFAASAVAGLHLHSSSSSLIPKTEPATNDEPPSVDRPQKRTAADAQPADKPTADAADGKSPKSTARSKRHPSQTAHHEALQRIPPIAAESANVIVSFVRPAAAERAPQNARQWHAPGAELLDLVDKVGVRMLCSSAGRDAGAASPPPSPLLVQRCWHATEQLSGRDARLHERLRQLNSEASQHAVAQKSRSLDGSRERLLVAAKRRQLTGGSRAPKRKREQSACPCVVELCGRNALPLARHCLAHVMLDARQLLFSSCTAKFADNSKCGRPSTFDVGGSQEMPLCREHLWKRDNYSRIVQVQKQPKKSTVPRPKKPTKPGEIDALVEAISCYIEPSPVAAPKRARSASSTVKRVRNPKTIAAVQARECQVSPAEKPSKPAESLTLKRPAVKRQRKTKERTVRPPSDVQRSQCNDSLPSNAPLPLGGPLEFGSAFAVDATSSSSILTPTSIASNSAGSSSSCNPCDDSAQAPLYLEQPQHFLQPQKSFSAPTTVDFQPPQDMFAYDQPVAAKAGGTFMLRYPSERAFFDGAYEPKVGLASSLSSSPSSSSSFADRSSSAMVAAIPVSNVRSMFMSCENSSTYESSEDMAGCSGVGFGDGQLMESIMHSNVPDVGDLADLHGLEDILTAQEQLQMQPLYDSTREDDELIDQALAADTQANALHSMARDFFGDILDVDDDILENVEMDVMDFNEASLLDDEMHDAGDHSQDAKPIIGGPDERVVGLSANDASASAGESLLLVQPNGGSGSELHRSMVHT